MFLQYTTGIVFSITIQKSSELPSWESKCVSQRRQDLELWGENCGAFGVQIVYTIEVSLITFLKHASNPFNWSVDH